MTLVCCAPEQVFPALGRLQLGQGICECVKERGGEKKAAYIHVTEISYEKEIFKALLLCNDNDE